MIVSEVTVDDCKAAANLVNGIRTLKIDGLHVAEAAKLIDGLRWLQDTAVKMAQAYSAGAVEKPAAPVEPPKESFTVKQYEPGQVGAAKGGDRKRR